MLSCWDPVPRAEAQVESSFKLEYAISNQIRLQTSSSGDTLDGVSSL